jgi:hypothetical protein
MRRGLALLLCVYLLVWMPASYAAALLAAIPSLEMRGERAIMEIGAHGIVTLLGVMAGWMIATRAPAAVPLARAAVIAAGAASIQSLFWSVLPHDVAPGQRQPLAAVAIAHTIFWLVMLRESSNSQKPTSQPPNSQGSVFGD